MAAVAGVTSGMDYKNPRIEKVRDAAEVVAGRISVPKLRPVVPILPVELVESILTPPGPCPVKQHACIFGAIVATPPLARVGMSVVLRQQT
jgi:hypothetical protein